MGNTIYLKLKNYKQYNDAEFETEGSITAFLGENGSGKSSALQSIEEALMAKNFVKTPIKKGEKESSVVFKAQRDDQDPIQISIAISEGNKYEFTAAYIKDGKVKNISDPKKIRELIGNYYPLTVESCLNMTSSTDGRRRFINEYLLPLLGEEKQKRLETLQNNISDKKNKATEGNWYHTRTEKQRELTGIEGELKAATLSEEDKATIASKDNVVKALNKLKEEKELHKGDDVKLTELNSEIKELNGIGKQLDIQDNELQSEWSIDAREHFTAIIGILAKEVQQRVKKQEGLYTSEQITALDEKITRGNNKLTEISVLEKKGTNTDAKLRRDKIFNEVTEINDKIEKAKEEIKLIYSNSSLPSGLQIDEEGLIILNGFELSENTNSETEVHLAIIGLLIKLNTCGFINIGDWSDYDKTSRKKILKLAQENNCLFIGQQVTEDTEVVLQTLIID